MSQQDNPLRRLNAAGQSVWYDNIQRAMLTSGELARLIAEDDLRGVTSNPSIFEKAIAGSHDYDAALKQQQRLHPEFSSRELFHELALQDIGAAADLLLPVYNATAGADGMVSLEVSPDLAYDTAATLREARELHTRLARPNVMIKVPATEAGLPAIEQLIADGININVTLLFAVPRYEQVVAAYLRGLKRRLERGQAIDRIASVASFFVSRLDTLLDPLLAQRCPELQGTIAIANAKWAYERFQDLFGGARFAPLAAAGARPQRLLWASTSTKNPAYPDVLYVETLIGPQTINTMPPATYVAFRDHGRVDLTLARDLELARTQLARLPALGIDLAQATAQLETEGVAAFAQAFEQLLGTLDAKIANLASTA